MEKYFALYQDGNRNYMKVEISNPLEVLAAISKKADCKHWHLSVSGVTNKIDCNPAAPLFIYGAVLCHIIVDSDNNIIYNSYLDSQFCQSITERYLLNAA